MPPPAKKKAPSKVYSRITPLEDSFSNYGSDSDSPPKSQRSKVASKKGEKSSSSSKPPRTINLSEDEDESMEVNENDSANANEANDSSTDSDDSSKKSKKVASSSRNIQLEKKNIRKQYSELIESCQTYEEKDGFDMRMQKLMTANIEQGKRLFNELGGGPGDMYLAFMHTRVCANMLKNKTLNIGSNTSAFKVDDFLESLMEKCLTPEGDYQPRVAVKCISSSASDCCRTMSHIVALVGSFDRDGISAPKERKPRLMPRRKNFDENMANATQHVEVKLNDADRNGANKSSAEFHSKEILKCLKKLPDHRQGRPVNLYEFTLNKTSFAATIESLFYVAFLIHDGDVRLFRNPGKKEKNGSNDATLLIKADKPHVSNLLNDAKKDKTKMKDKSARSQFILSFSAKKWRAMMLRAQGDDIISEHRKRAMQKEASTSNKR